MNFFTAKKINYDLPNFRKKITNNQNGFSLLEVLVSLAIITITFITLLEAYGKSLEMEGLSRDITIATIIAKEHLERIQLGEVIIIESLKKQSDEEIYPNFFWDIIISDGIIPEIQTVSIVVYKKIKNDNKNKLINLSTYLPRAI